MIKFCEIMKLLDDISEILWKEFWNDRKNVYNASRDKITQSIRNLNVFPLYKIGIRSVMWSSTKNNLFTNFHNIYENDTETLRFFNNKIEIKTVLKF